MSYDAVWTPDLGREVLLRPDTSDRQVWADTFTGRYHLPPPEMPPPRTVLDLGANIGLTAAHYRSLWPQAAILAVEMDPDSCALIQHNAPGVQAVPLAVSDHAGIGHYDPSVPAEAFRLSPDGPRAVVCATPRQITAMLVPPAADGRVDFVKMDIEGAEWGILAGEWLRAATYLLVELHPAGAPIGDATSQEDESRLLLDAAAGLLARLGFDVRLRHADHPRAVWAWRREVT